MSDARELALENRIARAEADAKSWRCVAEELQDEITRWKSSFEICDGNRAGLQADYQKQKQEITRLKEEVERLNNLYLSAVMGRKDFRQSLKECRDERRRMELHIDALNDNKQG